MVMLASARFPRENLGTRENPAEWLKFVWAVNEALPGTFGKPENVSNSPFPGYETERYAHARIIHGPGDEGIRVVAESPDVARAFAAAASALDIHIQMDQNAIDDIEQAGEA